MTTNLLAVMDRICERASEGPVDVYLEANAVRNAVQELHRRAADALELLEAIRADKVYDHARTKKLRAALAPFEATP